MNDSDRSTETVTILHFHERGTSYKRKTDAQLVIEQSHIVGRPMLCSVCYGWHVPQPPPRMGRATRGSNE